MIRLAYPLALLALLALPALWWLWSRPHRRTALRFSSLDALRAAGASSRSRLRLALPILRSVALACLVVAVARPQIADQTSQVYAEGIAIQMVVDTSSSMTDTDLSPPRQRLTRLDVVKDVFRRFITGDEQLPPRRSDLVGMIRFARYADSVCPLTLDYPALLTALESVAFVQTREEDGTAIGDGLALAVERLKDLKRTTGTGEQLTITSRAVILLTDGENNAGMLSPVQAGELAATFGIKVYAILAGTGQRSGFTRLPIDPTDLRQIAELTGGRFFEARDANALSQVVQEIAALERTRVEERRFVRWGELATPWLLAAFAALALQTLLDATRLRKIP
ncbi:MAG: VWA domain-containing protein [Phycisphaerae bacterium]